MKHRSILFLITSLVISISSHSALAQTQKGADIDGGYANDKSGTSVSMPNTNTIAIGTPFFGGSDGGKVDVFTWDGSAWTKKGNSMYGEDGNDQSGSAVSMPDENTVAIGAYLNDGIYGFNDSYIGHVRVYQWNGASWVQKGADIDGENEYDRSGCSVSMPDANTVAIGAMWNDGTASESGHARIYKWNGTAWVQKGIDLNGEAEYDYAGSTVCMPDSNTIAVGAPQNDGNGIHSGHVRIHSWNGTAWVQKGADIDGEAVDDESGSAISMPDSNTVAIGAKWNDGNGVDAGHVRIYRWNGSTWVQKGTDIDGEAAGDYFGCSVSMSDSNTVAIGASDNAGGGIDAGHVRIFKWNGSAWVQRGTDIDGEAAYDYSGRSVSMPDTITVGIGAPYNDGLANGAGHVRVYSLCATSTGTDVLSACDSLTWINGITYYADNNSATWTINNAAGCDSTITLDLTINTSPHITDTQVACDSLTWIDGTTYYANNNTATHILNNPTGCDTVVTLDLTINNTQYITDLQVACDSLTWIDGITYYANNNTATHILNNPTGCDTLVTLNLTINYTQYSTDSLVACDSLTWIDGVTYYSNNNTATHILNNPTGCDTVVTLDLSINSVSDISTTLAGTTVTANNVSATYAWLDCDNLYSFITGETNQSFTASSNGNYAVELTENGCIDTSACVAITTVGIDKSLITNNFIVFPNPTDGKFSIEFNSTQEVINIKLLSVLGQDIQSEKFENTDIIQLEIKHPNGVYILELSDEKGNKSVIRVVKE